MNNKNANKDINQKTFKINLQKVIVKAEVNQLFVDNKKMTNRFFFQIWHENCFNHEFNFIGDSYFGIVKYDASDYLLWLKNGELRRTNLYEFMRLNELHIYNLAQTKIKNWQKQNRYFSYRLTEHYKKKIEEIPIKEVEKAIKNCQKFYNELRYHKIYLR